MLRRISHLSMLRNAGKTTSSFLASPLRVAGWSGQTFSEVSRIPRTVFGLHSVVFDENKSRVRRIKLNPDRGSTTKPRVAQRTLGKKVTAQYENPNGVPQPFGSGQPTCRNQSPPSTSISSSPPSIANGTYRATNFPSDCTPTWREFAANSRRRRSGWVALKITCTSFADCRKLWIWPVSFVRSNVILPNG